jgi:mannan endo-1,6-alpha-mannosidase
MTNVSTLLRTAKSLLTRHLASILSATSNYAYGLMTYYKNNASGIPAEDVGIFPKPHYWWEAGAAWGGLIEYTQFTGDKSYVETLTQALISNYGPNKDILLPWRKDQEVRRSHRRTRWG